MSRSVLVFLPLLGACRDDSGGDVGIALSLAARADNTLIADASVTLDEPGAVTITLWSADVEPMHTPAAAAAIDHAIPVLGMRADSLYYVQASAALADGTILESDVQIFETGGLPHGIPPLAVSGSGSPAEITLIGPANPVYDSTSPAPEFYLIGVDGEGQVVWYYAPDDLADDESRLRFAKPLSDGNLLMVPALGVRIVTPDGRLVRDVKNQDLGVEQLHHDATLLPNGNLVLMGLESREMEVSAFDEPVLVEGDVLIELDEAGDVVWRWSAFDHLDTDRWPGELSRELSVRGGEQYGEWTHGNSVVYEPTRDALILSLRHQNWVIAVSRETGEVLWRLGEEGDFELRSGEWFTSQHAAAMPAADEVLLYDNGNEKETPYSRAVAYRIDEEAGAAEQIWAWDTGLFTSNQGDVDALEGGSVLVCAGGERESGDARVAEITSGGEVVRELDAGDGAWLYRATRVQWLSEGGG